jgi:predicted TPR repeat methyltransferase
MIHTEPHKSAKDKASAWLTTAMERHQREDFDAAAQAYRQVLDVDPDHVDALHYLGVVYYQLNQANQALPLLEKAVSLAPADATCKSNLGLVLLAVGDTEKAIEWFRAALQLQPDFADAYNNLGNALMRCGRIDAAISAYQSALSKNDEQPSVHNNLGVALQRQDLLKEAIAEYLKALKLAPRFVDAAVNLGEVLLQSNRFEDAIRCYRQLNQLAPDKPLYLIRLGNAFQANKQLDEALVVYRQAVALDDTSTQALLNLGAVTQQIGDLHEALNCYKRVLEVESNCAEAHNNIGTVLSETGDLPGAQAAFEAALRLEPCFAEAHYNLARVCRDQNNFETALTHYRAMIEHYPKDGRGYFGAAQLLDLLGRYDDLAALMRAWDESGSDLQIDSHLRAAFTGQTTERATESYVLDQFSGKAARVFDEHLTTLRYQGPKAVFEALQPWLDSKGKSVNILDAGCGTGLCGAALKPYAKRIIGVDLSADMLAEARAKGIYDELIEKELTAFLETNTQKYDLITCADTFIYFGSLSKVLGLMSNALAPAGQIAFTVERLDDGSRPYALMPSGRYAHSGQYLANVAAQNGLQILSIQDFVVRYERSLPISGLVAVAAAQ